MKNEAIRYFQHVLGQNNNVNGRDIIIRRRLNADQQEAMLCPVTELDVKNAMFGIDSSKAPRPDGYNAAFFKCNWEIVGPAIIEAALSFFSTGKLLKSWNSTSISLIPKVQVPNTMKDFRTISCLQRGL